MKTDPDAIVAARHGSQKSRLHLALARTQRGCPVRDREERDPARGAALNLSNMENFEAASGGAAILSSTARVTSSTVKRFMQARSS